MASYVADNEAPEVFVLCNGGVCLTASDKAR